METRNASVSYLTIVRRVARPFHLFGGVPGRTAYLHPWIVGLVPFAASCLLTIKVTGAGTDQSLKHRYGAKSRDQNQLSALNHEAEKARTCTR